MGKPVKAPAPAKLSKKAAKQATAFQKQTYIMKQSNARTTKLKKAKGK